MGDLGDSGCDVQYGHGLVQAKSAYELLAQGNCGGNLGKVYPPKGGCEQSVPDGPTAAPTPECTNDSQCDDGDACTVDTCDNGLCLSTPQCASCGKSKVDVEIAIDNYGEETAYDIKDASGNKVMEGSGWPANSVNSFWKCVGSGEYTFRITDAYGDGICCNYGNGGYVVEVDDDEVASGGQFAAKKQKYSKLFHLLLPHHLLVHLPLYLLLLLLYLLQLLGHLTPPTLLLRLTLHTSHLQCTQRQLQILCPLRILPISHQLLILLKQLVK